MEDFELESIKKYNQNKEIVEKEELCSKLWKIIKTSMDMHKNDKHFSCFLNLKKFYDIGSCYKCKNDMLCRILEENENDRVENLGLALQKVEKVSVGDIFRTCLLVDSCGGQNLQIVSIRKLSEIEEKERSFGIPGYKHAQTDNPDDLMVLYQLERPVHNKMMGESRMWWIKQCCYKIL
jgi:hypothetical protein